MDRLHLFSIISACILAIAVAGCSRTLSFRVIDAGSGAPLSAVAVVRHSYTHHAGPAAMLDQDDSTLCGSTDANGSITVRVFPGSINDIFFNSPNYLPARAEWTAGDTIHIASPQDAIHPRTGEAVPIGSKIQIPLHARE